MIDTCNDIGNRNLEWREHVGHKKKWRIWGMLENHFRFTCKPLYQWVMWMIAATRSMILVPSVTCSIETWSMINTWFMPIVVASRSITWFQEKSIDVNLKEITRRWSRRSSRLTMNLFIYSILKVFDTHSDRVNIHKCLFVTIFPNNKIFVAFVKLIIYW